MFWTLSFPYYLIFLYLWLSLIDNTDYDFLFFSHFLFLLSSTIFFLVEVDEDINL